MDIQARKISLIQEFLRINSEELINKLDKFLYREKKKIYEKELKPMSFDFYIRQVPIDPLSYGASLKIETIHEKNIILAL